MSETDLASLIPYVEAADDLMAQVASLHDLRPNRTNHLTERFLDVNRPAGHRPYIMVSGYLANAHEHSQAFWALVQSNHGLTPRAPWSLLRSVFESGFWATWVLDSGDSLTRRRRGLRMELVDHAERDRWINELPLPAAEKRAATKRGPDDPLRSECSKLGLEFKTARTKPNVIDEIKVLRFMLQNGRDLGPMFAATWRSLSGAQHSLPWALLAASEITDQVEIEGGQVVQVSVKDDVFIFTAKLAYALFLEGARHYVGRSTQPPKPA